MHFLHWWGSLRSGKKKSFKSRELESLKLQSVWILVLVDLATQVSGFQS